MTYQNPNIAQKWHNDWRAEELIYSWRLVFRQRGCTELLTNKILALNGCSQRARGCCIYRHLNFTWCSNLTLSLVGVDTVMSTTCYQPLADNRLTIPFMAWQRKHRPRVTARRFPHARHLERGAALKLITLHFKQVSTESSWLSYQAISFLSLKYQYQSVFY